MKDSSEEIPNPKSQAPREEKELSRPLFSERKRREAEVLTWLSDRDLPVCPFNVITALSAAGYLKSERAENTAAHANLAIERLRNEVAITAEKDSGLARDIVTVCDALTEQQAATRRRASLIELTIFFLLELGASLKLGAWSLELFR